MKVEAAPAKPAASALDLSVSSESIASMGRSRSRFSIKRASRGQEQAGELQKQLDRLYTRAYGQPLPDDDQ